LDGKIAEVIVEDDESLKRPAMDRQNSGIPLRRNISTNLTAVVRFVVV
jgi:hypothetical protein